MRYNERFTNQVIDFIQSSESLTTEVAIRSGFYAEESWSSNDVQYDAFVEDLRATVENESGYPLTPLQSTGVDWDDVTDNFIERKFY